MQFPEGLEDSPFIQFADSKKHSFRKNYSWKYGTWDLENIFRHVTPAIIKWFVYHMVWFGRAHLPWPRQPTADQLAHLREWIEWDQANNLFKNTETYLNLVTFKRAFFLRLPLGISSRLLPLAHILCYSRHICTYMLLTLVMTLA